MADRERTGKILVGIDGSEPSKEALRWAIDEAERGGGTVEAITTWELPAAIGFTVALPENLDLGGDAEKLSAAVLAEVVRPGETAPLTHVLEGHPASVLVELSAEADLLVVGKRGHGAFAGMLLGSVSTYCIGHAHCPVVVVHAGSHP